MSDLASGHRPCREYALTANVILNEVKNLTRKVRDSSPDYSGSE